MIVLIPAFEPDGRLIELVEGLRRVSLDVIVVDDGSGTNFADTFGRVHAVGAEVLRHPINRGKGRALKTGLAYIEARLPGAAVVSADCDGQHRLADIAAVAARLTTELGARGDAESRGPIVLGARSWSGPIPWKSRLGNGVTRRLLRIATGLQLGDTQTGLRAFPPDLLGWLQQLPGERFEYEMNMLLAADLDGVDLVEHPIDMVYVDGNASTHFDPLRDSIRVYRPLLRSAASRVRALGRGEGARSTRQ